MLLDLRQAVPFAQQGDVFEGDHVAKLAELVSSSALRSISHSQNDDRFGDMVALKHIALLGEGHCLALIQRLVTGQVDTSTGMASILVRCALIIS